MHRMEVLSISCKFNASSIIPIHLEVLCNFCLMQQSYTVYICIYVGLYMCGELILKKIVN